jgi:hypothetical protein
LEEKPREKRRKLLAEELKEEEGVSQRRKDGLGFRQ